GSISLRGTAARRAIGGRASGCGSGLRTPGGALGTLIGGRARGRLGRWRLVSRVEVAPSWGVPVAALDGGHLRGGPIAPVSSASGERKVSPVSGFLRRDLVKGVVDHF